MEIKAARRFSVRKDEGVFKRLGRGNQENIARTHQVKAAVCKYWLEGRCARNPCRFLHPDLAKPSAERSYRADSLVDKSKRVWKNPDTHNSQKSPIIGKGPQNIIKNKVDCKGNRSILMTQPSIEKARQNISKNKLDCNGYESIPKTQPSIEMTRQNILKNKVDCNENQSIPKCQPSIEKNQSIPKCQPSIEKAQENILKNKVDYSENQRAPETEQDDLTSEVDVNQNKSVQKKQNLCNYRMTDNLVKGDKCENLRLWFSGDELSMVARLEGHTKAVTGIVLPSGCDRLYCVSKDKSLRVLDCHSGHCRGVVNFNDECGTLVNESPWIFAGLHDMIKAWNLNTLSELVLQGSGGQVNAITMFEDVLFAGMEDGTILSWKSTSENSFSEVPTSLKGHTGSVLSLVVGAKKLFSGSADHTIRVWDPKSLKCMHVLNGHTDDVTTVLCWDSYLLSGSLDKKIKVWAATDSGNIEEVYEHYVDDGVLAFCGMHGTEGRPILLCSCKDNGVCLYDLPSFYERNRVYSKRDIQSIEKGPDGLFFTGDTRGLVSVWRLHGEAECKSR